MDQCAEMEFRYRVRRWVLAMFVTAVALMLFAGSIAVCTERELSRATPGAAPHRLPPAHPVWATITALWHHQSLLFMGTVYVVCFGSMLLHERRLARHGRVRLTAAYLELVGGRGRARRVDWPEIREVHLKGGFPPGSPGICFRSATGRLAWIDPSVEKPAALAEAMIARAGLTEKSVRWWGTVYRRSAEA